MEDKLTIEHLQHYLSHNLKVEQGGYRKQIVELVGLETETSSTQERFIFKDKDKDFYRGYLYECKPYLRSLSQLTQEIEHNGVKFFPIKELFLSDYFKNKERDKVISVEFGKKNENKIGHPFYHAWPVSMNYLLDNGKETGMYGTFSMKKMEYFQWKKLFEWHFDVFGLIEKGLALELS